MWVDFPLPSPPSKVMNLPFLAIFREILTDDSAGVRKGQDLAPSLLILRVQLRTWARGKQNRKDFSNATNSRQHRRGGYGQSRGQESPSATVRGWHSYSGDGHRRQRGVPQPHNRIVATIRFRCDRCRQSGQGSGKVYAGEGQIPARVVGLLHASA